MLDVVVWVIPAALIGASELAFASRTREGASSEAVATDHAVKAATAAALTGPVLVATMLPRPLPAVVWTGLAIAVAGVVLRSVAMMTLKGRYRLTPQRQSSDHYLVRSGLYGIVRHPGYAGILTAISGMALIASGFVGLLFVVPVAAICAIRIAGEERLLRDEFGVEFHDHCRAVQWRLLPCLY